MKTTTTRVRPSVRKSEYLKDSPILFRASVMNRSYIIEQMKKEGFSTMTAYLNAHFANCRKLRRKATVLHKVLEQSLA